MSLPLSGQISIGEIKKEFGGGNSLSQYYAADAGVPTSGTIKLSDFYGKSAFIFATKGIVGNLLAGIYSSGGGPTAYPGYIRKNIDGVIRQWRITNCCPINTNFCSDNGCSAWKAQKDIAIVGSDVTAADLLSIGIDPNYAFKATGRTVIQIVGYFDHGISLGEMRFTVADPWTNFITRSTKVEDYDGRNKIGLYYSIPAPSSNQIIVPAYRSDRGDHSVRLYIGAGIENTIKNRTGIMTTCNTILGETSCTNSNRTYYQIYTEYNYNIRNTTISYNGFDKLLLTSAEYYSLLK